jgi:HEAT repeat protein
VRESAARSLAHLRDRRALDTLVAVASDPSDSPTVRPAAIRAMANLEGKRAIPLLTKLAKAGSESPWVRTTATECLVDATNGVIDDLELVAVLARCTGVDDSVGMGEFPGIDAIRQSLILIIKHGKTKAVRAAALTAERALRDDEMKEDRERELPAEALKALEEQQPQPRHYRTWLSILSFIYYPLALGFWMFRYRKSLKQKQFTLASMFLLTILIAIGLPLVVVTWNGW